MLNTKHKCHPLLLEKCFFLVIISGQIASLLLLSYDGVMNFYAFYAKLMLFSNVNAFIDGVKYLLNDLDVITSLFSFHLFSMVVWLLIIIEHDLDYYKFISFIYSVKVTKDFINLLIIIRNGLQLLLIKIKSLINIITAYFLLATAEISCSYLPFV